MAVRHPFGETVTVTRPGSPTQTRDSQGNLVDAPDVTFTISDVALAPAGSDESPEGLGTWVVTGYNLFLPYGTVLLPTDRITIRGVPGWQVEGDSSAAGWRSPFDGRGRGVAMTARRAG